MAGLCRLTFRVESRGNLASPGKYERFALFWHLQDRQWTVPFRPVPASCFQENCDRDSQAEGEGHKVPQRGKPENKDEGTPRGEKKANESASKRKLVHGDAGMAIFGHGTPLCVHHPTSVDRIQDRSYWLGLSPQSTQILHG